MTKTPPLAKLVVLEPSKVGPQHITLLQGYLEALLALGLDARGYRLVYRADPSSHAALEPAVRDAVPLDPIRVTDPEKRRWIRKGLEEVREVLRTVDTLGPDDLLLVTCLTAPALMILEAINRRLPPGQVVAVLHSELEALFDPTIRSPRSWGFWAYRWFRMRRPDSHLGLAVIAGYIRDRLEASFPQTFPAGSVRVLPFPIVKVDAVPVPQPAPRVSFVGYKTRFKGFPEFEALARRMHAAGSGAAFVTVGAGQVENAVDGRARPFDPAAGFLGELASSAVAVFPYQQGYSVTMSAAAIDAIAAGLRLLATPLPCFAALQDAFGADQVQLAQTVDDMAAVLSAPGYFDEPADARGTRMARIAASEFGQASIQAAFRQWLDAAGAQGSNRG